MMPKMPKMLGANITSMLMKVSRMRAMTVWRNQLKDLVGNNICWMALRTCGQTQTIIIPQCHFHWALQGTNQQHTYREQHDGDGQCYSCEDGHSHTQDQSVIRVNPAVSVQQLRLHIVYRNIKKDSLLIKFSHVKIHSVIMPSSTATHIVTTRGSLGFFFMCRRRSIYHQVLFFIFISIEKY